MHLNICRKEETDLKYLEILEDEHAFDFDYEKYKQYLTEHIAQIGENYVDTCISNEYFHDYILRKLSYNSTSDGSTTVSMLLTYDWAFENYEINDELPAFIVKYENVVSFYWDNDSEGLSEYLYGEAIYKNGYINHEIMLGGKMLIKSKSISVRKITEIER